MRLLLSLDVGATEFKAITVKYKKGRSLKGERAATATGETALSSLQYCLHSMMKGPQTSLSFEAFMRAADTIS